MEIDYTVQIWREGDQYVAHAMPLDVASCGPNPAAARAALEEAINLFLVTARDQGTLAEALDDAGYANEGTRWKSPDWVCFEKGSAAVGA